MELALPQLAQVVTVYEFLLMKVSLGGASGPWRVALKSCRRTSFLCIWEDLDHVESFPSSGQG